VQRERDRQLREESPFEGYPNMWAERGFRDWLFGYDAYSEADVAWERFLKGRFPGTAGSFAA